MQLEEGEGEVGRLTVVKDAVYHLALDRTTGSFERDEERLVLLCPLHRAEHHLCRWAGRGIPIQVPVGSDEDHFAFESYVGCAKRTDTRVSVQQERMER